MWETGHFRSHSQVLLPFSRLFKMQATGLATCCSIGPFPNFKNIISIPNTRSRLLETGGISQREKINLEFAWLLFDETKWPRRLHESLGSWWWDHVASATNKTHSTECLTPWVTMCKWGRYDECNQHYTAIKTCAVDTKGEWAAAMCTY